MIAAPSVNGRITIRQRQDEDAVQGDTGRDHNHTQSHPFLAVLATVPERRYHVAPASESGTEIAIAANHVVQGSSDGRARARSTPTTQAATALTASDVRNRTPETSSARRRSMLTLHRSRHSRRMLLHVNLLQYAVGRRSRKDAEPGPLCKSKPSSPRDPLGCCGATWQAMACG